MKLEGEQIIIKQPVLLFAFLLSIIFFSESMHKSDKTNAMVVCTDACRMIPSGPLEYIWNRVCDPKKYTVSEARAAKLNFKNILLASKELKRSVEESIVIYFPENIEKEMFLAYLDQETGQKEIVKVKLSQFLKYVPGYLRSKQKNELKDRFSIDVLRDPSYLYCKVRYLYYWVNSFYRLHYDVYGHSEEETKLDNYNPVEGSVKYTALGFFIENYREIDSRLKKQFPHSTSAYMQIKEKLLENFADVNARDSYGRTPLFYAITNPECPTEIVQLLLDYGADTNDIVFVKKYNKDIGQSARSVAATNQHFYKKFLYKSEDEILQEKRKLLDPYLTLREQTTGDAKSCVIQ